MSVKAFVNSINDELIVNNYRQILFTSHEVEVDKECVMWNGNNANCWSVEVFTVLVAPFFATHFKIIISPRTLPSHLQNVLSGVWISSKTTTDYSPPWIQQMASLGSWIKCVKKAKMFKSLIVALILKFLKEHIFHSNLRQMLWGRCRIRTSKGREERTGGGENTSGPRTPEHYYFSHAGCFSRCETYDVTFSSHWCHSVYCSFLKRSLNFEPWIWHGMMHGRALTVKLMLSYS